MPILLGIFVALLVVIPIILFRGFVLTYLWEWFVMPFGAPEIGVLHAIGLSLIIGFFTARYTKDEDKMDNAARLGFSLMSTLVIWGFGWIIHVNMT